VVSLVQRVDLPLIFETAGDATKIVEGSEQPMQQDQGRAFAGNTVIQLNSHGQSVSGLVCVLKPDTLPLPALRASTGIDDHFPKTKKSRAKPGMKVIDVKPEKSAIEDAVQVLCKLDDVFPLKLGMGYKDFLFHNTPPDCLSIAST
jgi:hypothetical protein